MTILGGLKIIITTGYVNIKTNRVNGLGNITNREIMKISNTLEKIMARAVSQVRRLCRQRLRHAMRKFRITAGGSSG